MFYLAPAWAESPLSPDNAKISFVLADDLQVELVACEPLIASPCAIAFDAKGRMFVAENRGYPRMETPPQGVVAMLTDADGDGRMDQRTVFADRLTYPNGVLPWKDGLIVTCAPDVLFLRDTNGDGKADEKRVLLTGFATTGSTQLRVNAPQIGPDGWIYLAAGLSGGNLTCPEHPERPALKMTSDVRFHPDTLEVQPVDGKSQFGQSFDAYGRRFICMNRLPVQHVVLESKWLARNPQLAFSETVQDCNERDVKTVMKGGGDGVRLFPISSNITTADSHQGSFSAACGITIWRSGALPARYDGGALSCDPTANVIHCDKLEPTGASFRAVPLLKNQEMLASRDDWFRPVFLTRGPDGALYVADMYRKVIEHPDYLPEEVRKHTDFESGRNQGRIWRISAKTPMPTRALPPFIDEFTSIQPAAKDDAKQNFSKRCGHC
jgi:putative membrane-bound dehydrogenase-like protein